MPRHQLTDAQWDCIAELLPPPAKTGRPRADSRQVMNAILWVLRSGAPWRDLPAEYPPFTTVWHRFDQWNQSGLLAQIVDRLRAARVDLDEIDEELWCVDGTIVRAARCAAGGAKKGIRRNLQITH